MDESQKIKMRTVRSTEQPSLRDFCYDSCCRRNLRQKQAAAGDRGRPIKQRRNRNSTQEMKAKEMKKQESVEDVVSKHLTQALSLDNHNSEPKGSPKPRQVGAG